MGRLRLGAAVVLLLPILALGDQAVPVYVAAPAPTAGAKCTGTRVQVTTSAPAKVWTCQGGVWVDSTPAGGGGGAGLPSDPAACTSGQFVTDQDIVGTLTCSAVGWGVLSGKPATFAPSAHTHPGSDVTTAVANATTAAAAPWAGLTGVPATFPTAPASCAYAVKTLDGIGGSTCTSAPTIPLPSGTGSELQTRATASSFAAYAGSGACAASNWMTALDASGAKTCTRPAYTDLTGAPSAYVLPDATASVTGGVRLNGNLSGTATSPTVVGITGAVVAASNLSATGITAATFLRGDNTWAAPAAQDWTVITGKPATFPATVPVSSATTSAALSANYVASVATTAPVTGGAAGSNAAALTIAVSDATTIAKGVVQLAGQLGGTAASPTVTGVTGAVVGIANLNATGTPGAGNFLRGDGTWNAASGGGAPTTSKYILQQADGALANAQATGALGTGILKSTTTTGVLSIAAAGTDYVGPTAGSAIQKASAGGLAAATSGTDFAPGTSGNATGLVKSTTGTGALTTAASGTDYGPPTSGNGTGLVLSTTGTGAHTAYGGATCTNQFPRVLSASGAPTCASVALADFVANLGTTTTVLHGNAAGQPAFSGVSLTADALANQGTTTTLLHGNAAGQPAFSGVALADHVANLGTVNQVLHGNAAGQPTYSAVDLSADTAATLLPQAKGGTGAGATTCSAGQALTSNGTVQACTGTITANAFSGTLPLLNGGTANGSLTVTAGGVNYMDGTKVMASAVGTLGQALFSNAAAAPSWGNSDRLVMLTSDYTNATTSMTATALTWTSPAVVSRSVFDCILKVKVSVGTIGAQLDVTASVAPTDIAYRVSYVTAAGTAPATAETGASVGVVANSTAVGPATGATTYTIWRVTGGILHTASASTVTIRAKASGVGTITIGAGSSCSYGIY